MAATILALPVRRKQPRRDRFRRSLIREIRFEVRVLTRINEHLAMRAERDLIALGG